MEQDQNAPKTCVVSGWLANPNGDPKHALTTTSFSLPVHSGTTLSLTPGVSSKKLGHVLVASATEVTDKVYGALEVVKPWFDRSLSRGHQ